MGRRGFARYTRFHTLLLLTCVLVGAALCALALAPGSSRRAKVDPAGGKARGLVAADARPLDPGWFIDVTNDVGVDFVYYTGARGKFYMPEIMVSGAALFDYDNDGDLDLYLTNGNDALPGDGPADGPRNRLFRQESNGRFTDVTLQSGLGDTGYGMGVALGDFDNDGFKDVYVTNCAYDRLYRNAGDGTFEDVTKSAGIDVPGWSASAAFVDYDRNGFLDLYVTQYVEFHTAKVCSDPAGRPDYCSPKSYRSVPDVLLHNNGDGTFADVSSGAGIASASAAGLGIVCDDFNDDGWVDMYVANDGYANNLWINKHNGTFRDEAIAMGAAYSSSGKAEAGMGVVAGDFDGDGMSDVMMTHLRRETNTLYRNLGGGMGFDDVTGLVGLSGPSIPFTGFGLIAFDCELDGDLDLFIGNGGVTRGNALPNTRMQPPWDVYAEPNQFYLNDGRGHFRLRDELAPAMCQTVEISRGVLAGDIDQDGDLDVVVTNIEGPTRIYRNEAPPKGRWLFVRAVDPRYHRDALGARVNVAVKDRTYVRTIRSADSYLCATEPVAHFGLVDAGAIAKIEVLWPDGLNELFPPPDELNRSLTLSRGSGTTIP